MVQAAISPSGTIRSLKVGEPVTIRRDGGKCTIRPESITQRNWSRVGIGRVIDGGGQQQVFLKQFLASGGVVHREHFEYERQGWRAAAAVRQDGIEISQPIGESVDDALLVYPALRVITPDELLRRSAADFSVSLPGLLQATAAFLRALPEAGGRQPGLTRKERAFGSGSTALNFKGLDIRNIGLPLDEQGKPTGGRPVMFDFGRPYLAPIEEAAGKLLVSFGLLNWGWPLDLFIAGPDESVVEAAARAFSAFLDREATRSCLAFEMRIRLAEPPQGVNAAIRLGKKAVIGTVGRWHLHRLEQLLDRVLARPRPAA